MMSRSSVNFTIFAVLCGLLEASDAQPGNNPYVTSEDIIVANDANLKIHEYCGENGQLKRHVNFGRAEGREELLKAAGGDNIILNILTNANSSSEVGEVAQEELVKPAILFKVTPLLMAIALVGLWLICCWSVCPCCKCCRCATEWNSSLFLKIVAVVVIIGLAAGILVSAGLATEGYNTAVDGFDNVACTSSELLNVTLSGQTSPSFIGMMPLLSKFHELDQNLDDNSNFLRNITSILDSTEEISMAVGLASQTLSLLANVLREDANVHPKSLQMLQDGDDGFHTCIGCKDISDALSDATSALDEGIATALAKAREEVDNQLSPARREELQQSFRDSTAPLVQVKTSVRESFSLFVEDDSAFDRIRDYVDRYMYQIVLAIIFAAVLLLLCGCLTVACFAFKEKNSSAQDGVNPYNSSVHRCACCTWCCAFIYAFIAFFIGGLLYAVTVPLSSACLIMDDVNSQMLKDIAPAIGIDLDVNSTQFTVVADIIDECFNPTDPSTNANLLDLLKVQDGNESNGTVSMRTKISAQMQEQIVKQFDLITTTLGNLSVPELANNSVVVNLRTLLAANPIDTFILPDHERMLADTRYKALAADPRCGVDSPFPCKAGVQIGLATSMNCSDHTIEGEIDSPIEDGNISGIDSFVSKLEAFGILEASSSTCARKVEDCGSQSPINTSVCEAGNKYIDLKRELLASDQYRCDLFEDPTNPCEDCYCDPSMMTQSSNGKWVNDCLDPVTKRATIKQKNCTLPEFVAYVRRSSVMLDLVLSRVDATVPDVKEIIDVSMRSLMDTFVINPVTEIVDGVTCGFVSDTYQELIDGLCYQGVVGFNAVARSYVACAALSFILILVTFTLWCRGVNNVDAWEAKARERRAQEQAHLQPVVSNV